MIEIYDLCYRMELACNGDVWGLKGRVYGHPNHSPGAEIRPSCPVSLERNSLSFKTASGSEYQIMSFDADMEKVLEQMEKDIKNGGYEVH